jgi:hypothetical protein
VYCRITMRTTGADRDIDDLFLNDDFFLLANVAEGMRGWRRGGSMPVTDAMQRVTPAMSRDHSKVDHAQIAFVNGIKQRNKRLVVHHYASRSFEDYQIKMKRGAGDHERTSGFRGMGFFDALKACVPTATLASASLEKNSPCGRFCETPVRPTCLEVSEL